MATVVICANALGLIAFLVTRADRLLTAVVDPLHPDFAGMERAYAGFTVYAVSLIAMLAVACLPILRAIVRASRPTATLNRLRGESDRLPTAALACALTAAVVVVFIEVLLFQDYGVHLYEFDVFGILLDGALRRDLGIQPAEVIRVTVAAATLLAVELVVCAAAFRLAAWRDGALPRAWGTAMLLAIPGGLALLRSGEVRIASDRAEFEGALPLGNQLLLRRTTRPFIAVEPRLGRDGYPTLATGDPAPRFSKKINVVFFVADGLRADMVKPELTPNLLRFGARPDVISPRRHFSTGHVSEAGLFGLLYGLRGPAFHSFIQRRVPAFPLEVLRRNGYHTFLLASSRLNPYPSDQLVRLFDEVAYPTNDDEAVAALRHYVAARRTDGKPYFVLAFFYTPHYPFTSAKPEFRHYPLLGLSARTNYMNDVLQADDYFRQTFDILRTDYESGRTALLATSDHGEEIRDHGVFGHASATFWNEKILVPFFLGLPGATIASRRPALTSHVDVWPTLFDYLGEASTIPPSNHADGASLLRPGGGPQEALISGRFFPYADRPSVLVDSATKYWFRIDRVGKDGRLCVILTRITDLNDSPTPAGPSSVNPDSVPALRNLQRTFWHFIRYAGPQTAPCSAG